MAKIPEQCPATIPFGDADRQCGLYQGHKGNHRSVSLSQGDVEWPRETAQGFAAHNAVKTHCPKGHPFDAVNTLRKPDGSRGCRTCIAASKHRWYENKKAKEKP